MNRTAMALTAILVLTSASLAKQQDTLQKRKKIQAVQRFQRQVQRQVQRHQQNNHQVHNQLPQNYNNYQNNSQQTYNTNHHSNTYGHANYYGNHSNNCNHGSAYQSYMALPPTVVAQRRHWLKTLRNVKRSLRHCHCTHEARNQIKNLIHCVRTSRPMPFNRRLLRRLRFLVMELNSYDPCLHQVNEQIGEILWDIRNSIRC